jgi:hypothetical protein
MLLNQTYDQVPINTLALHPDNPRRGNVPMIAQSVEANGFYGALIVQQSTRRVLAGNHRMQAAIQAGIAELPVLWVDVDDDKAKRILLADNRTNDTASYAEGELVALLQELDMTEFGLAGTGYEAADLDDLLVHVESGAPQTNPDGTAPEQKAPSEPEEGFNRYEHRDEWEASGRRLIILDFPVPLFVWVQERLAEVGGPQGLEANTDIIVSLLQAATGQEPPQVPAADPTAPEAASA